MPGKDDLGLPEFARPPVIETVLGVHFRSIRGLSTAHLGLFWQYLGREEWPKLRELGSITPQIERFDVSPTAPLRFAFKEIERPEVRLRLDNADESKVIQVQPNLLLTHWVRKPDAEYPRYAGSTKPGFLAIWQKFCNFLADYGFAQPDPVQWEVTYINRVFSGGLWKTPREWPSLFKGVLGCPVIADGAIESAMVEYHYRLSDNRGRLHVDIRHAAAGQDLPEALDVILTARGQADVGSTSPVESLNTEQRIALGLDVGRGAIVRGFVAIMSEQALDYWGYQKEKTDA